MKNCIDVFDGENRFLSNFYYAPIIYNGKKYSSTEVAYQAAKASNEKDRNKFNSATTSIEAKNSDVKSNYEMIGNWLKIKLCMKFV